MINYKQRNLKMQSCCTIFLLLLLSFAANGQTRQEFIGTWKADVSESINRMDAATRAKYDSLPESSRRQIEESVESQQVVFNSDNTILNRFKQDDQEMIWNGVWTVDFTTSSLVIASNGSTRNLNYEFISPRALILAIPNNAWFNKIYLTKI